MKKRMRPALMLSALALLATVSATPRIASADDSKPFRMIVGEPRYMDPNLATDYSIYVNAQLFQPLARMNKDGNLTMQQAKSIEVAPDGRTWTITLNPDYKWSNGQPITAADWEYSWKRILDPKTGSEVAVFLSDVENADDYNKGKITDFSKVGIKATGDYTFQVVTTGLAPQFRAKLALPYLTPVPQGGRREVRRQMDRAGECRLQRALQAGPPGSTTSPSPWTPIPITAARSRRSSASR